LNLDGISSLLDLSSVVPKEGRLSPQIRVRVRVRVNVKVRVRV